MSALGLVAAQLHRLLAGLTAANSRQSIAEMNDLCDTYGAPASVVLMSILLRDLESELPYKQRELRATLLKSVLMPLAPHVSFTTMFSKAAQSLQKPVTAGYLNKLCDTLKLPYWCQIAVAASLTNSANSDTVTEASRWLRINLTAQKLTNAGTIPDDLLHRVVTFIRTHPSWSEKQRKQTCNLLEAHYPAVGLVTLGETASRAKHMEAMPRDGAVTQFLGEMVNVCSPAQLLQDLGYDAMASVTSLQKVLSHFPKLSERDVADIVSMMVRTNKRLGGTSTVSLFDSVMSLSSATSIGKESKTEKPSLDAWRSDVFLETMKQLLPQLRWAIVYQHFDTADFFVPDRAAFDLLTGVFKTATHKLQDFPLEMLLEPWKNVKGQLSLLKHAVHAPTEVVNFMYSPRVMSVPSNVLHKEGKSSSQDNCWFSLDLIELLLRYGETEHVDEVRQIMAQGQAQCPELLLFGLLAIQKQGAPNGSQTTTRTMLGDAVLEQLLGKCFEGSDAGTALFRTADSPVVRFAWEMNAPIVLEWLVKFHSKARSNVSRIMEMAQSVNGLDVFLADDLPAQFTLDVAAMAASQHQLDLRNWLLHRLSQHEIRQSFLSACLEFLRTGSDDQNVRNIVIECVSTVDNNTPVLSSPTPKLSSPSRQLSPAKNTRTPDRSNVPVKPVMIMMDDTVEREVARRFDAYFTEQVSLEQIVKELSKLKGSNAHRDQQSYECTLHNLFDEYRFFHRYPPHELELASRLFGALIRNQVLEGVTLGLALRYVLEALRYPVESALFSFGLKALENFQQSLGQWPTYCLLVLQISTIQKHFKTLCGFLAMTVKGTESPDMPGDTSVPGRIVSFTADLRAADPVRAFAPAQQMAISHEWGVNPNDGEGNGPDPMLSRSGPYKPRFDFPSDNSSHAPREGVGTSGFDSLFTPRSGDAHQLLPSPVGPVDPAPLDLKQAPLGKQVPMDNPGGFRGGGPPSNKGQSSQQGGGNSSSGLGGITPKLGLGFGGIGNAAPGLSKNVGGMNKAPKPISSPTAGATPGKKKPATSEKGPGFGGSVSIDTLLQAQNRGKAIVAPADNMRDKMHFIINNVDGVNYRTKAHEMIKVLKEKYYGYLCQYLVIRRVSVEVNFQKAYSNWIDEMNLPGLKREMIATTYTNINILVNSSKILKLSSERSLLKNLGSWLGLLTVAIDKPILSKYLNLKELILSAYENERLVAVIPFVAKVLEHCATSKIFHMPNPWFTRILSVLKELYELPELKLNLKFAIEVMFNGLDLDPKDIESSHLLRELTAGREKSLESADGSPALDSTSTPNFGMDDSPSLGPSGSDLLVPTQYIVIHPSISVFSVFPQLKRLVPHAMDHAIKEILQPVVERSVTIACVTARELVMKDFAFEPDETKMRTAAHAMVKTMTASLALVTCKEPLRSAMQKHLSKLLESNSNANPAQIERACMQLATDNLAVCCAVIENAASERAVREIDESLAPLFNIRRKHRQENPSTPFAVVAMINSPSGRIVSSLPDRLRPSQTGLTALQLQVYDDFNKLHPSRSQNLGAQQELDERGLPKNPQAVEKPGEGKEAAAQGGTLTSQQTLDKLIACMHSLTQAINNFRNSRTTGLQALLGASGGRNEEHEVIVYLRRIPQILNQAPRDDKLFPPEVVAFTFAHKVFKSMFEPAHAGSLLYLDVHLAVLKRIASAAPKLVNELTAWLFGTEDDNKFKLEVLSGLIKLKLLYMHDVDGFFSKLLHVLLVRNQVFVANPPQPGNPARPTRRIHPKLEFVINFVRRVVCKEGSCYAHELARLCDRIATMAQQFQNHPSELHQILTHLLQDVRGAAMNAEREREERKRIVKKNVPGDGDPDDRDIEFVKQMARVEETANALQQSPNGAKPIMHLFDEWMNICLQGNASDKTYAKYLNLLQQQRVLITPESSIRFFRIITQICVNAAFVQKQQNNQPVPVDRLSYTAIDALAKLVVFLVKFLDPSGGQNPQSKSTATKIRILSLFLNSVAWSLLKDYEAKADKFNQKPYLRLFTNLLNDLNTPDPSLDSNNTDVLIAFARVFTLLRPTRVPAFAFAWLELISHRTFMPKMLISKKPACMNGFHVLLVNLFQLLQPHLTNADLTPSVRFLYKGTLRVLLVLLHDFPEFLCEYHFAFCDVIPTTCIQMRNLILSAFPRSMRLPDPFTPNLKVDLLPEIAFPPRIASDMMVTLEKHRHELIVPLDVYLKNRQPSTVLQAIVHALVFHPSSTMTPQDVQRKVQKTGTKFDVQLINGLVLYVGAQGIAKLSQNKDQSGSIADNIQDTACMDLFVALVKYLDAEGRYYVLNAIANQLRYPNNHTHYFSQVLLYLFAHEQSVVKEQITRVLLERLIVHRPHPWGLLITFIELIKNPAYDIQRQPFTRIAPEIEKLFESVARSCMPQQQPEKKPDDVGAN